MRDLNARWFQKLVDESIDFSEELRVPEIRFHGTLSKFKHFDWVMAKLVLILAYQIGKIWEISTLLTDDSALNILRAEKWG